MERKRDREGVRGRDVGQHQRVENLSILHTDRSGTLRAFSRQTPYCVCRMFLPTFLPFRLASRMKRIPSTRRIFVKETIVE